MQGDKALMGGLMRGDIDLMGGGPNFDRLGMNHYFSNGGYHFSKAWTQFFFKF